MQSRTRFNVEAALAGEAMAALRYQLFADAAIEEGHERIAELFAEAAMKERTQHFRELAILVGLVGPTRQNLRAALAGEVTEHRSLYPRFASQAAYLLPPICNIEDGPSGVAYYPGTGLNESWKGTIFSHSRK